MIRQIRYFQSVIRNNSFSEAAEECHISQSAISQQVQALERELGFDLLERKNRKFSLTPAGEHFYKKSLVLIADYERMCQEARRPGFWLLEDKGSCRWRVRSRPEILDRLSAVFHYIVEGNRSPAITVHFGKKIIPAIM